MATSYRVNEVFLTVQGEGVRAGTVNVFVRFTGCNLACRQEPGPRSPGGFDCDTEFASGRTLARKELVEWIKQAAGPCRWVIFTGGEPGLQLDAELVADLKAEGFKLAIETNGSIDVSALNLDWVCVSPKVAEHAIRQLTAHEVKYVRSPGQGIPKPACKAENYLISPAFDGLRLDPEAMKWCIKLVHEHPEWRVSVQMHKSWSVR